MKNKTIRKVTGMLIALLLAVAQLCTAVPEVQAAAKTLNITDLSLSVGQSQKLKVSGVKQVKWSSSKKSVATVSKNGTVKAKKAGTATITATFSGKKLKCSVTVHKFSKSQIMVDC